MSRTIAKVRITAGTATLVIAGRRSELRGTALPALRLKVIDRLAREAGRLRETLLVDAHDPDGIAWFTIDAHGVVTMTDAPPASEQPAEPVAVTRPKPVAPSAEVALPDVIVSPVPVAAPEVFFPAQPIDPAPSAPLLEEQPVVDIPTENTIMRVRPRRVAAVALNTDQAFTIGNPVVIGRRPQPVEPMDEVFQVRDISLTLSKSHVRLFWDKGELYGVDLDSGNGVVIVDETGLEHHVPVGRQFRIEDGARLELGNVVAIFTIHAENADDVERAIA